MEWERGRRWLLQLGMRLSPLRETEQIGGDKSMTLFSDRRARNYDDNDDELRQFVAPFQTM